MSEPSISLTFHLQRSTWEFLQGFLDDAAEGISVARREGDSLATRQIDIEVHNTANTVRSALQTVVPAPAGETDWLKL